MALDSIADELPRRKLDGHEVGQDLSKLSIEELDERIVLLEREIERLKEARAQKENTRAAASSFFRLGS